AETHARVPRSARPVAALVCPPAMRRSLAIRRFAWAVVFRTAFVNAVADIAAAGGGVSAGDGVQLPRATDLVGEAVRVVSDDGTADGVDPAEVDVATSMYRWMLLNRVLDEKMMILQRQGRVGFYGAYTGQE